MIDIVTFETAKALKAAGFPQPEPEIGQVWYIEDGEMFFIVIAEMTDGRKILASELIEDVLFCYAPTATDILRELGDQYQLWLDTDGKKFVVSGPDTSIIIPHYMNINPAEACAFPWLNLKIAELWQEMSNRIPAQGEARDKFNAAKGLFSTTKESISLLNNGDLGGVLKLFENHATKDFPPGGFSGSDKE